MIVIATRRGTIRVADHSTMEWFGCAELVGSSLLGFVAPTERLDALQFVEELVSRPMRALIGNLHLGDRGGREQAHTVLGVCVGDLVVIQLRPRRQSADDPDESMVWVTEDGGITTSVPLPVGSTVSELTEVCHALTDAEVDGVHFGATGMSIITDRYGDGLASTGSGACSPVYQYSSKWMLPRVLRWSSVNPRSASSWATPVTSG